MSTGPLSDTFPGNLAGAAALWRPRQRGSRWSQDGWGLGCLQALSLLQQGKFLSELTWAFQWNFFPYVFTYTHSTHTEHTSIVLVAEFWPLRRAVGLLAQCGRCL